MPQPADVTIDLTGIQLTDAESGEPVPLAGIRGVHVLVLLRLRR